MMYIKFLPHQWTVLQIAFEIYGFEVRNVVLIKKIMNFVNASK